MPRTPRNPGTGKAPVNTPARGAKTDKGLEGWGGPAKGAGNRSAGPGRPVGVKDGEGKAARARQLFEEAAPLAAQVVLNVMQDAADPRNMAAALSVLNRVGLHEKSGLEHTAPDGPLIVERVLVSGKTGSDA